KVPKKLTVTRVAAARTRYLIGAGTKRINDASRAGGADESGPARLIWTHAAHYTADAMIAVCLAGTIFFSAARSEQRTQVALYLLVTMAPFAVVAPFIGPALDRLQRGRALALGALPAQGAAARPAPALGERADVDVRSGRGGDRRRRAGRDHPPVRQLPA